MLPRIIAQYIISVGTAVGKAVRQAISNEMGRQRVAASNTSKESDSQAKQQTKANVLHGMSLQEAVQILNITAELDPEQIQKNYQHLFTVNEKATGGSFYLQSKVVRAKERVDAEMESRGIKPDQVDEPDASKPPPPPSS